MKRTTSRHVKWREMRRRLLGEQNWRCAYCGTLLEMENATVDHVIARSRGGGSDWGNLVAACADCNHDKDRDSYLDHTLETSEGFLTIAGRIKGAT